MYESKLKSLRLDAGEGNVHGFDGSETLVESADPVGDGEVDGCLSGHDGGIGALVQVCGRRSGHLG